MKSDIKKAFSIPDEAVLLDHQFVVDILISSHPVLLDTNSANLSTPGRVASPYLQR